MKKTKSIRIDEEVWEAAIEAAHNSCRNIGNFVELAIRNQIEAEKPKSNILKQWGEKNV
jgi:predicted transcriptional regulator